MNEACAAAGIGSDTTAQLILSFKDNSVKEKLKATTQEAFDLGVSTACIIIVEYMMYSSEKIKCNSVQVQLV